jgi:hypothetical protein
MNDVCIPMTSVVKDWACAWREGRVDFGVVFVALCQPSSPHGTMRARYQVVMGSDRGETLLFLDEGMYYVDLSSLTSSSEEWHRSDMVDELADGNKIILANVRSYKESF